MGEFTRKFDHFVRLQEEPLFQEKIRPDIEKGEVFPAIRDGYVSFYYKSGGIFQYRPEIRFTTHRNYANVKTHQKKYVTQIEMQEIRPTSTFLMEYENIKNNCIDESKYEANAVSDLYQYNLLNPSDVILLDTEVVLDKATNRIDLAFYEKSTGTIAFCEAKYHKNTSIGQPESNGKSAIAQTIRYDKELENPKKVKGILEQYQRFIAQSGQLFDVTLPVPKNIFPLTSLLVLGGDEQKNERLKSKLLSHKCAKEINCYFAETVTDVVDLFQHITKGG